MSNKLYIEGWMELNKLHRGTYNTDTIYYRGDIVRNLENSYTSLVDNNIGNSIDSNEFWELLVSEEESLIINDNDLDSTTSTLSANKIKSLVSNMIQEYIQIYVPEAPSQLELPIPIAGIEVLHVTETSIELAWLPSNNSDSYDIKIDGDLLSNTSETSYIIRNLQANTRYIFTIVARNQHGAAEGVSINTKTQETQISPDPILPLEIADLKTSNVTTNSVYLTWKHSENETEFDIFVNGNLYITTVETECEILNLLPNNEYITAVKSKNQYGTSIGVNIVIRTLTAEESDQSLIFHLDLSGKTNSSANTVYDTVNNVPCTLHNVLHDGTNDGWLDERGLKLGVSGYVKIPSNTGVIHDSINPNTSGITFEFVAYNVQGILFRNENLSLGATITNVQNTTMRYITNTGSEKNDQKGHTRIVNSEGIRSITDTLHDGENELNVVAVRFYPNGEYDMLVNGRPSSNVNKPSDFAQHLDLLGLSPLYIRRNSLGMNTSSTIVRSFSIYNKVLSNADIFSKYEAIKNSEPIRSISVYPREVDIESGENQVIAVVASPSRYTKLLNNTFDSGNSGYVVVDQKGHLTGITDGDTEISVTSTYLDKTIVNYVPVKVGSINTQPQSSNRQISGISINRKTETLEIGQSYAAMATTLPFDVYDDNILVWESSNPETCTVNFGVLKGISVGTSTITVYDGTKTYSKSFVVNVFNNQNEIITETETYFVPLTAYEISANNSESLKTTNGIKMAMSFAAANKYKKIVFPRGTYLITPIAGTIYPPSEMIIDFSHSDIHIEPSIMTATGYTMIRLEHVSNTKIINVNIYGEADHTTVATSTEKCITVIVSDAYRSGFENCTISKSAGFNFATHVQRGIDEPMRHPSKTNFETGNINPTTGLNDDNIIANHFRNINFLNISKLGSYYMLGYTQGYFGYPHLRSRLYSIYFYDKQYNFIESQMYNLQFYNYNKPPNAQYAKIVIYQATAPTSHDSDFNAVAMLRTMVMPVDCFIRNCTFEDNFSCGVALTGGQGWIIENNTFSRNGKRMPSCDIDWEDGWETSVGDICRNNAFNSPSGVIVSGGSSIALYDNVFNQSNLHVWSRTTNFRIYNNFINGKGGNRNISLSCQADSYFSRNILTGVTYSKANHHTGANYQVRDVGNTVI